MALAGAVRRQATLLVRPHGPVERFAREVEGAGITGRAYVGMAAVPTGQVVGSVGRADTLRSDF
jgi:hypothetical protein